MNQTQAFLEDIKADANKMAALQLGANTIDAMIAEAIEIDGKSVIAVNPVGTAHLTAADGVGVVYSFYNDNGVIIAPKSIRAVGAGYFVGGGETSTVSRFDSNWSFLGRSALYDEVAVAENALTNSNPNAVADVIDFAVDVVKNVIYIASLNFAYIRAIDLSTGLQLWQFGDGLPLDNASGHLMSPASLEILQNGNLLVASVLGLVVGSANRGNIFEIDTNTGLFVADRISNVLGGAVKLVQPWFNSIGTSIGKMRINPYDGLLYVCLPFSELVAVFDTTTWQNVTTYAKPSGVNVGKLEPMAIAFTATELVVAANDSKMVAAVDYVTHDLKWFVGFAEKDDQAQPKNNPYAFWSTDDIVSIGNNQFAVVDSINQRISVVGTSDKFVIPYDTASLISAGWRLTAAALPSNYDPINHTLTVPVSAAATSGTLYLPIERAV